MADRGYDADWIRALVNQQGVWANIPPKLNRNEPICFSPYLYRGRNLVEGFFNKLKQCRRVASRYDKLAANYLAFIKLASIRTCDLQSVTRPEADQLSSKVRCHSDADYLKYRLKHVGNVISPPITIGPENFRLTYHNHRAH